MISYSHFLGDIFENYCRNDNLATFGRFCFGLSIITTFPLECFVTREVSDTFSYANLRIYQLNVYICEGKWYSEALRRGFASKMNKKKDSLALTVTVTHSAVETCG